MSDVIIYSTHSCSYCMRAKQLLTSKGVEFKEIFVDDDPQQLADMMRLSGRRTVPQIFINQQPIGGVDDLAALEHAGKLDQLLG